MNISARIADERVLDVRFDEASLIVDLMDGRTIAAPLAWYLRLLRATSEQRAGVGEGGSGLRHPLAGDRQGSERRGVAAGFAGTEGGLIADEELM